MYAKNRFQELDVLRGFAALAVMVVHYFIQFDSKFGPYAGRVAPPFDGPESVRELAGVVAVALFFVISGYVILMSLERSRSLGDFLYNRFSRLFPVFWVAVLLTTAVGILFPLPGVGYSVKQVVLNLTMMPTSFGAEPVDDVYWSLLFELRFYILLGLIMALGGLSRLKLICAGWLAVMTVFGVLRMAGTDLRDEFVILNAPFAPYFIAGICLYRLCGNFRDRAWWALLIASFAVTFLCFPLWFAGATLFFLPVFLLAMTGGLRFLVCRPLLFLGTISYSLYLIHMMIGYTLIYHLIKAGMPFVLASAGAMAVMIALAALLTFSVERPAQRWLRSHYRSRQMPVSAPAARQA